jgi:tetratricopeptide (TPR) repeat protein
LLLATLAFPAWSQDSAKRPENAAAYYEHGLALSQHGERDQAIADFKKAIELDPKRGEAYEALDRLLTQKGDFVTSIAYWTKLIALEPASANAYCERGGAYRHSGEIVKALSDATKACELGSKECCRILEQYRTIPKPKPPPPKPTDWTTLIFGTGGVALCYAMVVWLVAYGWLMWFRDSQLFGGNPLLIGLAGLAIGAAFFWAMFKMGYEISAAVMPVAFVLALSLWKKKTLTALTWRAAVLSFFTLALLLLPASLVFGRRVIQMLL